MDLKLHGLLPVVAGARLLALKLGERATSTVARLRAAQAAGIVGDEDCAMLEQAQALFLGHILDQQTRDIAAGLAPGVKVDMRRLPAGERRRIKKALRDVGLVSRLVEHALTADT
jgi:signal-transduction protein with cAMP-binding, CBS, and nucleotidyltransferase domain